MTEIVPATAEILTRLTSEPLPRTVRAIAAMEGDQILGATGYYPENGGLVIFCYMSKEMREQISRHKRTVVRCSRIVMGWALEKGMPIYAICDSRIKNAEVLLRHLGFEPDHQEVWQWRG